MPIYVIKLHDPPLAQGSKPHDPPPLCSGSPPTILLTSPSNVFKTIATFWRAKNKQKRFSKWAEVLPCFELNYKFLERHKKFISLVTTRKQENPVNTAQKMASKSSTKQHGEATIAAYLHFKVLTLYSINQTLDLRSIKHFRIAWLVLIDLW